MNIMPLILLGVLLNAIAQLFLKEGMNRIGHFDFVWANVLPIGLQVALSPFVVAGLFCYVTSVVVWLIVLSRVDVSYAYPMVSIGYIITAIAAYFFMQEPVSLQRAMGILVIIAGVYLLTRSV